MACTQGGQSTLVHSLSTLLRNNGDAVLDGTSTLTLQAAHLQHLTRLFEQHLLSRTHQHGFLALPSHPADTAALLQVQFLFDVLQKTISLKLVHPHGSQLQSVVKIFPFKSLKHLALKRIPPHCLEGLRGVYSQLEVFTCSKSLSSLEELLSLCGGDLSSALPWLELHTLNFSYNSISCLDDSLSLLNVLKSLDLSHNKIQDCAEFLKPLSELEHLNLSYNNLQRAPALGLSARAKLVTLILRNNELETINGVEQMSSLRHLDLAYNLLMEHSQLAPLAFLNCLSTLVLEGNPLFFQKTHRTSTVRHLSPKAAFQKLRLDGGLLTSSDLAVLPKPGQLIGQFTQMPVATAPEQGVQEASSGGGELSDSMSVSEPGASKIRRRRSKNKVRVRRASISEPSDTDHEPRGQALLQDIVLHHQKDIERMDSFREKLGEDWLRYQHHLDAASASTSTSTSAAAPAQATAQVLANGRATPSPPPTEPDAQGLPPPLLTSEPKRKSEEEEEEEEEEEDREEDGSDPEPETEESTLQWTGHSPANTESTLETSLGEATTASGEKWVAARRPEREEEEEDQGVDLCLPLLVGVVSDEEEAGDPKASKPVFLRVRQGHVLEVDMHQGRVRTRLELDNLRQVTASEVAWPGKEEEKVLPALELHFRYIKRERQRRCYVMLDDDPQQAREALTGILSRVAEENERRVAAEDGPRGGLRHQCLKCRAEFSQRAHRGATRKVLPDPDGPPLPERREVEEEEEEEEEEIRREHGTDTEESTGSAIICPECNSDHVVQLAGQSAPSSSTPIHFQQPRQNGSVACFDLDDTDASDQPRRNIEFSGSPICGIQAPDLSTIEGNTTDPPYLSAASTLSQTDPGGERSVSQPIGFQTPGGAGTDGREEELAGSYTYSGPQGPQHQAEPEMTSLDAHFDLQSEDAEAVDHRLKLFLDVEVFEGEEELQCVLKMSTVKYGDAAEFPSLMVVTDQKIYILEITSPSQGQPSDWLQKHVSHRLTGLSYLEVGMASQSIHLEFEGAGAAYTLLVRDSSRCKRFFSRLTGIVKELAHKSESKLKSISTTRLNPRHHLWPLVCEDVQGGEEEDCHPPFVYLLAFVLQYDCWSPVTILATRETLHLLDEDHQWCKSQAESTTNEEGQTSSGQASVRETQPISCVSSIHLLSSDPCRINVKLYDEMAMEEKTWVLRAEDLELVQRLVDWIKNQWEAMFGVKLTTSVL